MYSSINFYEENMPVSLSAIKNFTGAQKAPSCPFPVLTSKKVTTTLTSKSRFPGEADFEITMQLGLILVGGKKRGAEDRGEGRERRREGRNKET